MIYFERTIYEINHSLIVCKLLYIQIKVRMCLPVPTRIQKPLHFPRQFAKLLSISILKTPFGNIPFYLD